MPTRLKKPIVVSDTPISANQKDRVEAVTASGSPLENPISRIAINLGCRYTRARQASRCRNADGLRRFPRPSSLPTNE